MALFCSVTFMKKICRMHLNIRKLNDYMYLYNCEAEMSGEDYYGMRSKVYSLDIMSSIGS